MEATYKEKVDETGGRAVYLCARPHPVRDGKWLLYEEYEGGREDEVHDINRKVVATPSFVEWLFKNEDAL